MIYIKTLMLFFKVFFNLHKYKYFLEKPEGRGKKWTLYKRPIFQKLRNQKRKTGTETRAQEFIYHAFESLEAKSEESFKKEMFDNIALAIIWYNTTKTKENESENNEKNTNGQTESI